jgi:predicted XRE-type DNA-binding protein
VSRAQVKEAATLLLELQSMSDSEVSSLLDVSNQPPSLA